MIELIERAARIDDDRPAILTNDRAVSYPELLAAASSVATALSGFGIRRFAVVDHDAITVLALLAGAAAAGAEACVYAPAEDPGVPLELAGRFDHTTLVSARTDLGDRYRVLHPDELLTTDHAYNACRYYFVYVAEKHGAGVTVAKVPFPLESVCGSKGRSSLPETMVERMRERAACGIPAGRRFQWLASR